MIGIDKERYIDSVNLVLIKKDPGTSDTVIYNEDHISSDSELCMDWMCMFMFYCAFCLALGFFWFLKHCPCETESSLKLF